jgi:hypothetical protein
MLKIFKSAKRRGQNVAFYNQDVCENAWKGANIKQRIYLLLGFATFTTQSMFAQDAADEIKDLWDDQINPILNAILGIAVGIAAVVVGIQFFQGKKEALQKLGYVIAGAVVIKVLVTIIKNILSGSNNEID